MLLFNNSIENAVIEKLSKGSIVSPLLVQFIAEKQNVSFQGVYKAISSLTDRNVITKTKMTLSLNSLWLERITTFAENVSNNYVLNEFNDFLFLDTKEKVTYNFENPKKLDNQWLHFVLVIAKKFSNDPIFIWNPHHWFIFARRDEESQLFDWLNGNNRDTFLLIGDASDLDVRAKKQLQSECVRVNLDANTKLPTNKYYVVIDEYIMTTQYSTGFVTEVENIFQHYKEESEVTKNLDQLIHTPVKGKIVMERNKDKALQLSKKISKNFFLDVSTQTYLRNKN